MIYRVNMNFKLNSSWNFNNFGTDKGIGQSRNFNDQQLMGRKLSFDLFYFFHSFNLNHIGVKYSLEFYG